MSAGTVPFQTEDKNVYRVLNADGLRARYGLTPRESEIARYVARGDTNLEIARRFHISVFTVRRHVEHVLSRLDARRRSEVATRLLAPI